MHVKCNPTSNIRVLQDYLYINLSYFKEDFLKLFQISFTEQISFLLVLQIHKKRNIKISKAIESLN